MKSVFKPNWKGNVVDSKPRKVTVKVSGTAPLVYGRQVFADKMNEETHQQYEERTCLEKVFVNHEGRVGINPDAIKRSLEWAASWRNDKLPGGAGGKATFKKRFTAGVQPAKAFYPVSNGREELKPEDLHVQKLSVPSNGQRGGKTRVVRSFPTLNPPWTAEFELIILDHAIDEKVFRAHIETAGIFDGVGAMRVGNGGPNGSYVVDDLKIEEMSI